MYKITPLRVLSKRKFRDALRLRYDWPIPDSPSVCVYGCSFTVDHAMICQRGDLIIQRRNEIRDLEAELLDMVCYDVAIEPSLQPLPGRSSIGEQIQHQMHVSMCTVVDSGRDNGPPFWYTAGGGGGMSPECGLVQRA